MLKPFVKDLKKLAQGGITVTIKSHEYTFKGNLVVFLADNLASHTIGGFKESMGFAFRFCRKCMATKEQSQIYFTSLLFKLRNPEEHSQQCMLLSGPLKEYYSTTFGIRRNSILNEVPNFSVTTGLTHDIMHDLFEGIVPLELKLLLQHCEEMGYFSLKTLNEQIMKFDFGYTNESDRPGKFDESASGKIKLTAGSMWLFSRMLPIIIGDKIPNTDSHWKCYTLLLRIIDICTCHECSVDTVAYLSTLIEEHHSTFVEIYDSNIIPKMHCMVHYPDQFLNFGPIIHTWCMRMEAKLKLCKRVAKYGNFKNICYSIAQSHQQWMCLQLQSRAFLAMPPEIGGKTDIRTFAEEDPGLQEIFASAMTSVKDSHIVISLL